MPVGKIVGALKDEGPATSKSASGRSVVGPSRSPQREKVPEGKIVGALKGPAMKKELCCGGARSHPKEGKRKEEKVQQHVAVDDQERLTLQRRRKSALPEHHACRRASGASDQRRRIVRTKCKRGSGGMIAAIPPHGPRCTNNEILLRSRVP